MIGKKIAVLMILFFTTSIFAQFSIDNFVSQGWDLSISALKTNNPDKKFEISKDGNSQVYSYYDWLDPYSLKITLTFSVDSMITRKLLALSSQNSDKIRDFFNLIKKNLSNIIGIGFIEKTFFGKTIVTWFPKNNLIYTIVMSDEKVVLAIMKK